MNRAARSCDPRLVSIDGFSERHQLCRLSLTVGRESTPNPCESTPSKTKANTAIMRIRSSMASPRSRCQSTEVSRTRTATAANRCGTDARVPSIRVEQGLHHAFSDRTRLAQPGSTSTPASAQSECRSSGDVARWRECSRVLQSGRRVWECSVPHVTRRCGCSNATFR